MSDITQSITIILLVTALGLSTFTLIRQVQTNQSLAETKDRITEVEESYTEINQDLKEAQSSLETLKDDIKNFDETLTAIEGYGPTQDVLE